MFGLCAFTVDVGHWYVTVQNVQRAADAAALAGRHLHARRPRAGQGAGAETAAATTAGHQRRRHDGRPRAGSRPAEPAQGDDHHDGRTTRSASSSACSTETITRTAIANYQAPLPLGSPCNEFGNGPEPTTERAPIRAARTAAAAGQFWANVGSPQAGKSYGDAYQDANCASAAAGTDFCTGRQHRVLQRRLLLQRSSSASPSQPDHPGLRPGVRQRRRPVRAPTSAAARPRRARQEPVQLQRQRRTRPPRPTIEDSNLYALGSERAPTAPATSSTPSRPTSRRTRRSPSASRWRARASHDPLTFPHDRRPARRRSRASTATCTPR